MVVLHFYRENTHRDNHVPTSGVQTFDPFAGSTSGFHNALACWKLE